MEPLPLGLRRAVALLAILVGVAVVFGSSLPNDTRSVQYLHGTWARVDAPGELFLPGMLAQQGLPADGRVAVRRTVETGDGVWSLWVERPQYAIAVSWDDEVVGQRGDPDGTARSEHPLLVDFPRGAGTHELGLVLRGDYGEGGIIGQIAFGPHDEVLALAWRRDAQLFGFALGLVLLSLLHLGVALRASYRPLHLLFGLFAMSLALYAWMHASGTIGLDLSAVARVRGVRLGEGTFTLFGTLFVAYFAWGRIPVGPAVLGSLAGATLPLALLLPGSKLYALEVLQDGLLGLSTAAVGVGMWAAVRRGVPGSFIQLGSILPLFLGLGIEFALTHGQIAGPSVVWASILLFVGGSSMAVAVRDATESEQHRRLVRENADAMLEIGPDGRVREANPAALAMLGDEEGSFIGRVLPADRAVAEGHVKKSLGTAARAEFRVQAKGEQLVVESLGTPLDGESALLVLRDVTARRRIDQGLVQAARMETAALLVGGLTHDFNNLLGALLGHIGILQATVAEKSVRNRLEKMERTVERATLLTRRLLSLAGGATGQLVPLNVGALVENARVLCEPALGTSLTVTAEIPEGLPLVLGNNNDLEHVLLNLLLNARDALSGRGSVRIAAAAFALPNGARGVQISVEDDGPGIPAEILPQIWTPFFTTKGPTRGTGLGLPMVRQILRHHRGLCWYEPRPGGGARFRLALREAHVEPAEPETLPAGRTILVVDDEEGVLEGFVSALREAAYHPVGFVRAEEALSWLHAHKPDLVLSDVVMPGVSGVDLAQAAQELHPNVPILLVSGFIPEQALRGLWDARWARLDKPIRGAQLVEAVTRLLRRAEGDAPTPVDEAPLDGVMSLPAP